MKCYYEELGVERDANDGDIKTAYRKLALKWHPDKNLDCLDEAKERFQTIQQAYEVLSDPHERSWYDKHRDQILRGKNSVYEDQCLDVFQYFTVSCFKGYDDDVNGFYSIYREVFNSIVTEDAEFIEDEEELNNIPKFGDSSSNYEEVVGPFYAYWSAYCTKKTYSWLCPYDITEIKDRRILREIEKDMKKIRQKARKERNEEVRNLVAYVRKRDKRVQAYKLMLEERAALNRQKQEQNRAEQIRRRQKELEELRQNNRAYAAEDDDYEEELKKLELQYSDDDSYESYESTKEEEQEEEVNEAIQEDVTERIDDFMDNLYCVACNRAFKNKKAFANHETSKKHRDNLTKLKQEMHEEDNLLQQPVKSVVSDKEDIKENTENVLKEEPTEEANCTRKHKKDPKKSKLLPPNISDEENASIRKKFIEPQQSNDSEEDWTSTANKKNKNKQKLTKMKNPKNTESATNTSNIHIDKETGAKLVHPTEVEMPQHICATCHNKFESKNKLFAHLNITNHGVYIPKAKLNANDDHGKVKKSKGKRK